MESKWMVYESMDTHNFSFSPGFLKHAHLRDGDTTLFGKFLFGFFTGIWVRQVGVKILIEDLCGLFAEVAPLASEKGLEHSEQGFSWLKKDVWGRRH